MEERAGAARPVSMRHALVAALLLLAVVGALVELLRGRRPVLLAAPA